MKKRALVRYFLVTILSFVLIYTVALAATTISTNISTGGTLSVTGASTLTGLATLTGGFDSAASSTVDNKLRVDGDITASSTVFVETLVVNASSTVEERLLVREFYVLGNATTTGTATTTGASWFTGGFDSGASSTVQGTLRVTGAATTTGIGYITGGFDSSASSTVQGDMVVVGGNLRVGAVAFETWDSAYSVLQIGGNGAIFANTVAGASRVLDFLQNTYYDENDGRWEYQLADEASRYELTSGQHVFYVTESGGADAEITWTTALTINAAGNMLMGGQATTTGVSYFTGGFDSAASSTIVGDFTVGTSSEEMWVNASTTFTNATTTFDSGSTATTTVIIGNPAGSTGSCLQLYNDEGTVVYCRVQATTTVPYGLSCNTTSCDL